jgi:hypothetical protein
VDAVSYGLLTGGIAAALMLATLPFSDSLDGRKGEIISYTGIILATLLVL